MRVPFDLVRARDAPHVLRPLQIVRLVRVGREGPDDVKVSAPDDGLASVEAAQVRFKLGRPEFAPLEVLELAPRIGDVRRHEEEVLEFEREAPRAGVFGIVAPSFFFGGRERESVHGRGDGGEFAHDGDFARPVPVRVPLAQEGKVGIGLEHGVGVLLVHFGDGEDVRIFSFDVQPEPKLRAGGGVSFSSVREAFPG